MMMRSVRSAGSAVEVYGERLSSPGSRSVMMSESH